MKGDRTVALVMTSTLFLTGAGCARASPEERTDSVTPPAAATSTGAPGLVPRARRAPSALPAEPPVLATLPSGREVHVRSVGTTAAGLLDVPTDIGQAGWWRGGSRLGDPFGSDPARSARRLDVTGPRSLRRTAHRRSRRPHRPGLGASEADVRGPVPAAGAAGFPGPRDLALRRLGPNDGSRSSPAPRRTTPRAAATRTSPSSLPFPSRLRNDDDQEGLPEATADGSPAHGAGTATS